MIKRHFFIVLLLLQISFIYSLNRFYIPHSEYYMMDGNVNIREEPNLNAKILGKLQRNDKITLVGEQTWEIQEINGFESWWFKIQFNNIIGYVWGEYIADFRIVHNTNGIEIIVFFRQSNYDPGTRYSPDNDFFIFIDNKKYELPKTKKIWSRCFTKMNNDGFYLSFANIPYHVYSLEQIHDVHEYLIMKTGEIKLTEYQAITLENFRKLGYESR